MNVLVTGGTGHLGVVLSQLAHVERVFCLVRPKHGEDPRTRLARVEGLARFLRWAAALPRLRTFMYVGTAAICERDIRERVVREDESPNLAARHLVRYTKSKLHAERLVREQLAPEQVLLARPSILLGDRRGFSPRSLPLSLVYLENLAPLQGAAEP